MSLKSVSTPEAFDFISNIPPELLGEIFAYAAISDHNAPLLIGEVSRAFHRVVRMTPQVWTNLHLTLPSTAISDFDIVDERCARKALQWLCLSGVCPLHLHVTIFSGPSDSVDKGFCSEDMQDVSFPQILHILAGRIKGLELHSTTVEEARAFFAALYPTSLQQQQQHDDANQEHALEALPLESLVLHATSDGSGSRSYQQGPRVRSYNSKPEASTISLPFLPRLSHLKLRNHPLPTLSAGNVVNLRSLDIVYPLRFDPISAPLLLETLCAATKLERLEVEGRVVETFPPVSDFPTLQLNSSNSSLPTSIGGSSVLPNQPNSSSSPSPPEAAFHYPSLVALPVLSHLRLRVNNVPALLSHLLLPSLDVLKIDDLDGKRPGAARESGDILRKLLVRMELPFEGKKYSKGLRVLDMCGVPVSRPVFSPSSSRVGVNNYNNLTLDDGRRDEAAAASSGNDDPEAWSWCFNRMKGLEELYARKMDLGALIENITPQMQGNGYGSATTTEDIPLPGLKKLVIVDCDLGPASCSSSSMTHMMSLQAHTHTRGRNHGAITPFNDNRHDRHANHHGAVGVGPTSPHFSPTGAADAFDTFNPFMSPAVSLPCASNPSTSGTSTPNPNATSKDQPISSPENIKTPSGDGEIRPSIADRESLSLYSSSSSSSKTLNSAPTSPSPDWTFHDDVAPCYFEQRLPLAGPILKFRMRRPEVEVVCDDAPQPMSTATMLPMRASSPFDFRLGSSPLGSGHGHGQPRAPVDFLDFYSGV
ncbi:hypothetical protein D9613_010763 [Agrocybe pediades]|uniref:F-box domain-containing protein n=1 Tax=Agrocybe pediades TaxID=84607 RepID=A0A8H4VKB0_9AGAR|nr:hypothetical protein D9613_010763 [Agrocybe pediades]